MHFLELKYMPKIFSWKVLDFYRQIVNVTLLKQEHKRSTFIGFVLFTLSYTSVKNFIK